MLKAQELRIGNLVKYTSGFFNKTRIKSVDMVVLSLLLNKHDELKNGYTAIRLTEEWLLKFGFEKKTGIYRKSFDEQVIGIGLDGSFGLYNNERRWRIGSSFCGNNRIIYVHELQNFFFALTGVELELLSNVA